MMITARAGQLAASILSLSLAPSMACAAEWLSERNYKESGNAKGTVITSVNWGRDWACGVYENAQLQELTFKRLPAETGEPDIVKLEAGSTLFVDNQFVPQALLVEPGTYALTSMDVKVARSVRDVGHFRAGEDRLLPDGEPAAGTFRVDAGEIVYIGHFGLDCHETPTPWRYYLESREDFSGYVEEIRAQYPFLGDKEVIFRLFDTETLGYPYSLPESDQAKEKKNE